MKTAADARGGILEQLAESIISATTGALARLSGQSLRTRVGTPQVIEGRALLEAMQQPLAVIRAVLDGMPTAQGRQQAVCVVMPAKDAATLVGFMMMKPENLIEQQRNRGEIDPQTKHLLQEIANVACSAVVGRLRSALGIRIKVGSQDHGILEPGATPDDLIDEGEYGAVPFSVAIGEHSKTEWRLLLERDAAESWHGDALPVIDEAHAHGRVDAYLEDDRLAADLQKVCGQLDVEVIAHPATDIPNPAAHSGGLVVIDVPLDDPRRFEWCRRLKAFDSETRVLLVVHHPTRERILRAFITTADAILGTPLESELLAAKVGALVALKGG